MCHKVKKHNPLLKENVKTYRTLISVTEKHVRKFPINVTLVGTYNHRGRSSFLSKRMRRHIIYRGSPRSRPYEYFLRSKDSSLKEKTLRRVIHMSTMDREKCIVRSLNLKSLDCVYKYKTDDDNYTHDLRRNRDWILREQ